MLLFDHYTRVYLLDDVMDQYQEHQRNIPAAKSSWKKVQVEKESRWKSNPAVNWNKIQLGMITNPAGFHFQMDFGSSCVTAVAKASDKSAETRFHQA